MLLHTWLEAAELKFAIRASIQEEDEMADFIENDLSDDDAPRTDVKKAKPGRRQINLSDSDEE